MAPQAMPEADLTDDMIAAVMAKADSRVCGSDSRCSAFQDSLADARETCAATGRCKVAWIVRFGRRENWDVWREVSTGSVTLIRHADA